MIDINVGRKVRLRYNFLESLILAQDERRRRGDERKGEKGVTLFEAHTKSACYDTWRRQS